MNEQDSQPIQFLVVSGMRTRAVQTGGLCIQNPARSPPRHRWVQLDLDRAARAESEARRGWGHAAVMEANKLRAAAALNQSRTAADDALRRADSLEREMVQEATQGSSRPVRLADTRTEYSEGTLQG
eukprot:1191873-Prorocentrum_minimum.AAC.4